MDTVDHMRDLVLAAAGLAYRRTGSYRETARLLGPAATLANVHSWLVWCADPSDEDVHATFPYAQELIQGEADALRTGTETPAPSAAIAAAPGPSASNEGSQPTT